MKTITLQQAKKIAFGKVSIALGTFDGLHIGHLALMNVVDGQPGKSAVFTFDALPVDIFQAGHKPMRLFTMEEKTAAFNKLGVDYLCVAHFDDAFAHMEKEAFEQLLQDVFSPNSVIVGYNYTYGRRAEGTALTLTQSGESQGYKVKVISPVIMDGRPVSSTRIRERIWDGDVEQANAMLGYAYSMSGVVVYGQGIGRKLGFPTANIRAAVEKIVPKNGVYGVEVDVGSQTYEGVCSIGTNPTVSKNAKQSVEAHILHFDEDIYDQTITVRFMKRVRKELRFENTKQLIAQIKKDIRAVTKS